MTTMKVIGIERKDDKAIQVKLEGSGDTFYTNMVYLYLKPDAEIPAFGQEFKLEAL